MHETEGVHEGTGDFLGLKMRDVRRFVVDTKDYPADEYVDCRIPAEPEGNTTVAPLMSLIGYRERREGDS